MTKWRETRPASSRVMNSRWPASASGSIAMPVSSRTSRTTASCKVSPASTTPPGKVNAPVLAPLLRRAISTRPSRMMAALTARNGRSGYMRGSDIFSFAVTG